MFWTKPLRGPDPVGTPVPNDSRSPVDRARRRRGWDILPLRNADDVEEGPAVPIATPEIYNQMLDSAKSGEYAYPAINCTSSETVNAASPAVAQARAQVAAGHPPGDGAGGATPSRTGGGRHVRV